MSKTLEELLHHYGQGPITQVEMDLPAPCELLLGKKKYFTYKLAEDKYRVKMVFDANVGGALYNKKSHNLFVSSVKNGKMMSVEFKKREQAADIVSQVFKFVNTLDRESRSKFSYGYRGW